MPKNAVGRVLGQPKQKKTKFMKVGDRVRVIQSVVVYHHPEHKKEPFDIKGLEGEVIEVVTEWQGRPVSANLPVLVKFEKRFKAHFREDEVEVI
ncbi:ferredoxin-thioredoxin reductase variable chain [Lusitaniella coriacea LEGE 07167]|nr:ferredoxin-thioredoxin reductase variable chain [Lusitaniella coriacea]